MSLCRTIHDKNNPYTMLNMSICSDARLSFKAKGVWMHAFSRPVDWSFYISEIQTHATDGRESLRNALKELELTGYLYREPKRNKKGQMNGWTWVFFETSKSEEEIQKMFPKDGFPVRRCDRKSDNPTLPIIDSLPIKEKTTNPPSAERAPSAVCCLSLDKLNLTNSQKTKLSKEWTSQEIDLAVDRTLKWKGRTSDFAAITHVLKNPDSWEDVQTKEDIQNKNQKTLEILKPLDYQKIGDTQISIYNDSIVFSYGAQYKTYETKAKEFKKEVTDHIKKIVLRTGTNPRITDILQKMECLC